MKKAVKNSFLIAFFIFGFTPLLASAHQPRIVESGQTNVTDPEISKAYYSQLKGEPQFYNIQATEPFDLYVNILAPDIAGQKKDISAIILKDGKEIALLNGIDFKWEKFFEEFGYDNYWKGPEYKSKVEAGNYEIQVSSPKNDSKYSLAIGEIEAFDLKESLNALRLIPQLKKDFFNESPLNFILSPFGWGLILVMYFLGFMVGFAYRIILKKLAKNKVRRSSKNIGKSDRLLRFAIAIGLLLWAITTTWNPLLLFLSGFTLFEAIFSWCGLYAALGKATCPLN